MHDFLQVSFLSYVEMSCTQIASSQVPVSLCLQAGLSFHYKIVGLTDTEMFSSGQSPLFPESLQLTCLPAAWAPQQLSPTALPVHFLKHKRDCVAPGLRSFMAFSLPSAESSDPLRDMQGPRPLPVYLPGRASHFHSHSTPGQTEPSRRTPGTWPLVLPLLQHSSPSSFTCVIPAHPLSFSNLKPGLVASPQSPREFHM